MSAIGRITLPMSEMDPLQCEAREEGFEFVDRTVREWASGENRFDGTGELLCGWFEDGVLIAIGGLTLDPFQTDPGVGRIRRVFVRKQWRGRGMGTQIMEFLLAEAKRSFRAVRLRAANEGAARLYERLGFRRLTDSEATHERNF